MAKERVIQNSQSSTSEGSDAHSEDTPEPDANDSQPDSPSHSVLSHRFRESPPKTSSNGSKKSAVEGVGKAQVVVQLEAPARPWEYEPYRGDITVDSVLGEFIGMSGSTMYRIEYEDGRKEDVSRTSFVLVEVQTSEEIFELLNWALRLN